MIRKGVVRFVQKKLKELGLEPGPVDGHVGPRTVAALEQVNEVPAEFAKTGKLIAFRHHHGRSQGIETGAIDGYWGPQTEFAWDQLESIEEAGVPEPAWRPEGRVLTNPNGWPSQRTDPDLVAFYGEPGEQLTRLSLPYSHRLAWKTSTPVTRIQCHEKVHDSLGRVLQRVLETYGEAGLRELRLDLWGGCFNKRKMRGGTRWSMHSWRIAMDYDPTRNKLKWGRDRAQFALPD